MLRLLSYLSAAVIAGIASFYLPNATAVNLVAGFSVGMFIPVVDEVGKNREHLRHLWYSTRYKNRKIRVSAAYLFRIKIDDKYLLIRGKRFPQFQPVGGVYKLSPQGSAELSSMGVSSDDLIPLDPFSSGDLRVRVPGRNISRFFNWFYSRQGREDSPWREFQEELVASGILDAGKFPHILHNFVRLDVDKVRYSPHADSLEILVADIYELVPNREQEDDLRRLALSGNPDVIWASAQQIQRRGAVPGQRQEVDIAAHAQRIL
ncbi:hypothetical protein [Streptomyces sp. NPDC057382]|uniref:SMODS-associated NUDIX domain-containing protein n=1 Tax=unclassified Streptomyces TaxID=2593676 RepID=UPI003628AD95